MRREREAGSIGMGAICRKHEAGAGGRKHEAGAGGRKHGGGSEMQEE